MAQTTNAYSGQPAAEAGGGNVPGMVAMPSTAGQAPGMTAYYTPQGFGGDTGFAGMPQGTVVVQPILQQDIPKYDYTPNDFFKFSLITLIFGAIFSPLTVAFTIPALVLSIHSRRHAKEGNINKARDQGVCAAYLNVAAITIGLLIACVGTGVGIGLGYFGY